MTSDLRFHEHDRDASWKPERGSRRRRCALAATSVILALCPACVGYRADPLVPAVELAELLGRGETEASRERPPSLVASTWFPITEEIDLGDGLTLQEANALCLFYAPALVSARTRHRVAAAQLLSAGLLPNPELFIAPRLSTGDAQLVMPATLLFEIPLGDELSAEEDAARAKLNSAQWQIMQAELEVLKNVKLLFLRIAALRQQRARQESLRVAAQRIVEWVEQLSAAGDVDLLTLQLARLERQDIIASIQRQDIELARATTELAGLIGLHPRARVEAVAPASLLSAVELPAVDDSTVLRHPRLRAQESAYLEAEGLLRREVARQYPSLRIGPDLEYDRGDLLLGVGLSLPIPLFDQNRGQIAEAIEMRRAAREQYRETLLTLAGEEAAARRARDAALEYLRDHQQGALASAAQAEQALSDRLRSGYANVLEVLSARRAILRVRLREIELRGQVAEATLRAAVAGGFVVNEDNGSHQQKEE